MNDRTGEVLKSLYEEKMKHKDHRLTLVVQKLTFTAALLGVGSLNLVTDKISLYHVLYLVPFVTLAFDLYIFAEDYKVKRIGRFLLDEFKTDCEVEALWEKWVAHHREPLAAFASLLVTLAALGSSIIILVLVGTIRSIFWYWLVVSVAATALIFFYARHIQKQLKFQAVGEGATSPARPAA